MPYELWKRNEWTWDTLKTMARTLTVDKNKDGKPDVYGFGTETEFIFPLARGTDIVKNGGGKATPEAAKAAAYAGSLGLGYRRAWRQRPRRPWRP